jgi:hypothetical protein
VKRYGKCEENCEKKGKIQKEIVKRYGKYERKAS